MSRQSRPLRLTEEYRPDPPHCAAALLRLAGVKMARPDTTPAPAPTCDEAPREPAAAPAVER
jgi:hypothetical protein